MKRIGILFALFVGMLLSGFALSQDRDFPNRPIRVIVPFPPGAGTDIPARFFGNQLSAVLGQPVVVENRPGAFGAIGIDAVKRAPADGYTLLLASNSPMTVNPVMIKNLSYDPIKDLRPISGLTRNTNVFIVPANSTLHTLADLVTTAKNNKQLLNVGTAASGYLLVLEWFSSAAGVKFNNIPYKGGGEVYRDVVGGQLDWAVAELAGTAQMIKSGRLRALATSGETRHPDFPDVPTIKESGYPGFVSYSWNSFYVRSETPDDVTTKLADAMQKALGTNAAKAFVKGVGTELMPLSPVAMRKFQKDEFERFQSIANIAGIVAE
jgi:tripartite-type tricarboxylate transporter receptor subunit TctC